MVSHQCVFVNSVSVSQQHPVWEGAIRSTTQSPLASEKDQAKWPFINLQHKECLHKGFVAGLRQSLTNSFFTNWVDIADSQMLVLSAVLDYRLIRPIPASHLYGSLSQDLMGKNNLDRNKNTWNKTLYM